MSIDGMAITPYLHSWAYDQEKNEKKCGYVAFYKGRRTEVRADTSREAQGLAANYFRAKRQYEVTVILAEKDGKTVVHNGAEL